MSEIEKIHEKLDGKYWSSLKHKNRNHRERTNSRPNVKRFRQNPLILSTTDLKKECKLETLPNIEPLDSAKLLPSISRIEKTQEYILFELSSLRLSLQTQQQQQQDNRFFQLLKLLEKEKKPQNENDRPVSTTSFERFLNHFEQNISELRQSIENLRNTPNQDDVSLLNKSLPDVKQEEEDFCANQLLMLRKESNKNPTMVEALRKFDAHKGTWKWSAKNVVTNNSVKIDEDLSSQIEADYQKYFLHGAKSCCF